MNRITLRLPDNIYDEIWKLHSETRKSLNTIILELIQKGIDYKEKVK
jgi:predicted DNA-binding protein